jgi:8-oxo-dGTP diphosphatase
VKKVEVAVGVIIKEGRVYITKRADNLHQGGKWEFPGGKKEANETIEEALTRELLEEIGIDIVEQSKLMVIEHDYGDKQVVLDIRLVTRFSNEPEGLEGQEGQWVLVHELSDYNFPDANVSIISALEKLYPPDR